MAVKFSKPYFSGDRLTVWCDRQIRPGYKWLPAIEQALARARLAVLLLSPDFLASEFILQDELPPLTAAAEEGHCALLPILISQCGYRRTALKDYQFLHDAGRPLDSQPKPRRNAQWVTICEKLRAEAERVWGEDFDRQPAPAQPAAAVVPLTAGDRLGRLHGVPAQRPHFLARDELATLRETLLTAASAAVGVTSVGLYGMGGIGKTELAVALCHEEAVRRAFPDGIFWISLGQEPDILGILTDVAGMAGQSSSFASVPLAQEALRRHFADKTCLLVIDDLWRLGDARDLAVLGPRGRTLITTRDASLLTALAATEVALEVLSPPVALHLLSLWSGHAELLPPEAADVAEECGRLPLALAVAGARVRDGASWGDVLEALHKGDLEFLDHPYGSVFKSLRMSISALPADVAERYGELAVFPEDTSIPITTIERLWAYAGRLSLQRSRALLADLARKGLVTLVQAGRQETIHFHDLQQDFLKLDADDLPALHARLLDAHRPATGSWADLSLQEPYLWTWLCHHLGEAGRQEELKALLLDPAWIAAKLHVAGIAATVADYDSLRADEDVRLLRQALTLSAHVLTRDHSQLPGQLVGRLRGLSPPPITSLCARLERCGTGLRLMPQTASLTPPGGTLLRTLEGHQNRIGAVAVLPDGRRALSGSNDGTLKLWDLESGALLRTLENHRDSVEAVAVLPDGRRALSGSHYLTLKLWDLESGVLLRTLDGTGGLSAMAVLPDGRRALSGSNDGTLKLWDLESGALLRTLEGRQGWIGAVAVLPDSHHALSGGDNTLKLWDLESGALLRTFEGHQNAVEAVAVLEDGHCALSGSQDNTLKLWDLKSGVLLRTLKGHRDSVGAVAVLPDGRRALSGSWDHTLKLWDLESGALLRTFEGHQNSVEAVAVLPDGRRALSGSKDDTLKLWDLESGARPRTEGRQNSVEAVAVLPDGRSALAGSGDNTLKLWDLESGALLRTLEGHRGPVLALAVLPGGYRALSGSWDRTLKLWDVESGAVLRTLESGYDPFAVRTVAVLPDGRRALSNSGDDTLTLWDLESGALLRTLGRHEDVINDVAVLPYGRCALSASDDHRLVLWDLESGALLHTFLGSGRENRVAVLPDGRRALSGSIDSALTLWDLESGVLLRTLEGHQGWIGAVAVLPDSHHALSGSGDNTLKLWNLENGCCLATFTGEAAIVSVAAASDHLFVAGAANGALHILRLLT